MGVVVVNPSLPVTFADSVGLSAFGRVNVNAAEVLFSSQQQYGDDTTIWESAFIGTGANTFLPNEATIQMSTGGTGSTASAIRQSRLYHRYTPGHGLVAYMTFCMDSGATITNNTRRVGLFDASNGIFFEVAGATVRVAQRSFVGGSAVDAQVAQAAWNVDKFDGTGPSGVTMDWTKAQILVIDLQWLGVGRVRIGFNISGTFYPAHYFQNANAKTSAYMSTANLPVRYENFNSGGTASGTATLRHICVSVTTGGGSGPSSGKEYCYNNGPAGLSISSGSRVPTVSIRAKTTGPNSVRNTGQIELVRYDVAIASLNAIFWELVLNPVLTGASFAALNAANSIVDVDKSASAVSGGTVIDAGYISGSAQARGSVINIASVKSLILAYSGLLNTQDIMTLVCTAQGGTAVAICNLQWLEVW